MVSSRQIELYTIEVGVLHGKALSGTVGRILYNQGGANKQSPDIDPIIRRIDAHVLAKSKNVGITALAGGRSCSPSDGWV